MEITGTLIGKIFKKEGDRETNGVVTHWRLFDYQIKVNQTDQYPVHLTVWEPTPTPAGSIAVADLKEGQQYKVVYKDGKSYTNQYGKTVTPKVAVSFHNLSATPTQTKRDIQLEQLKTFGARYVTAVPNEQQNAIHFIGAYIGNCMKEEFKSLIDFAQQAFPKKK